jgi:hypothetical protein
LHHVAQRHVAGERMRGGFAQSDAAVVAAQLDENAHARLDTASPDRQRPDEGNAEGRGLDLADVHRSKPAANKIPNAACKRAVLRKAALNIAPSWQVITQRLRLIAHGSVSHGSKTQNDA